MAIQHFTAEQTRDLAKAYFSGIMKHRAYNEDWFNGGSDLFLVDGSMISLESAVGLFIDDEVECYYYDEMEKDVDSFCKMMGDLLCCDEVNYDYQAQSPKVIDIDYMVAIGDAWEDVIGDELRDSIRQEYYYWNKIYKKARE